MGERYLKSLARKGFSPRTIESYRTTVQGFVAFLASVGVADVVDLTREVVGEYQAALVTARTSAGRPLSLTTQRCRLVTVVRFLRWLVAQGALLLNPADGIEMPRHVPRRPPRDVPTEAEVEALLAAPNPETLLGMRDRAILEVLYSTGIRVGELVNLKPYDLDLSAGRLTVVGGKGGRDRVVPLGRLACEALARYLARARPALVGSRRPAVVFVSWRGGRLDRKSVESLVHQHCRKAGLSRRYGPHALRHACATHMLRGKASIRHIQELLGHRQLTTTQIYTHVEIEDLKAVHARTHPREKAGHAVKETEADRPSRR
jgi:integrase/recombinase XerD